MSETVTVNKNDVATISAEGKVVRARNSNVDVVKAVNSSNSWAEAAKKLGITEASVVQRIGALKKAAKEAGFELKIKKYDRKPSTRAASVVNFAELAKLAEESLV